MHTPYISSNASLFYSLIYWKKLCQYDNTTQRIIILASPREDFLRFDSILRIIWIQTCPPLQIYVAEWKKMDYGFWTCYSILFFIFAARPFWNFFLIMHKPSFTKIEWTLWTFPEHNKSILLAEQSSIEGNKIQNVLGRDTSLLIVCTMDGTS